MPQTLYWLAATGLLELLIWLPPLWRTRKVLACLLIPLQGLLSGLLFGGQPAVWTGLILLFSVYRIINLLRLLEGRLQARRLYATTLKTGLWLAGWQSAVAAVAWLGRHYQVAGSTWLYGLAGIQLAAALVIWLSTSRHLRTTMPPLAAEPLPDKRLPTLSVAIPARNETDELEACLQSLVRSDYPKLEILVLDDCSQNKRTPGIIRDFAQSGVRFIAGQVPPEQWLAKNYAYHQLSQEANGEILLFCGVDTRFAPGSLRAMLGVMLYKHKSMVSFIPRNQPPAGYSMESLLVQPARYAWELSLPRRLLRRPPVLSTCWLIARKELAALGGFEAVSRSISPESYFARSTARRNDGYSFLRSGQTVDLSSAKDVSKQRATAVRTRYPQLHRRPELVALSAIGELAVLVCPFALVIGAALSRQWPVFGLSLLASVLLVGFYARVVRLTYRRFLWRGLWALPLVAVFDIGLLNYSMWQYEFREVIWKGRNVCLPIMRPVTADSGKRP